jgi:hypothetical protein
MGREWRAAAAGWQVSTIGCSPSYSIRSKDENGLPRWRSSRTRDKDAERAHSPTLERRGGKPGKVGAGVGERSRSLGDFPPAAMNRHRGDGKYPGANPKDRAAATSAAPEPVIHQTWMRSQQMANQWEKQANDIRQGLNDPAKELFAKAARRPLAEHLAGYVDFLRHKSNTTKHVRLTEQRIRRLFEEGKIDAVSGLTNSAVAASMNRIRTTPERDGKPPLGPGRSADTCGS